MRDPVNSRARTPGDGFLRRYKTPFLTSIQLLVLCSLEYSPPVSGALPSARLHPAKQRFLRGLHLSPERSTVYSQAVFDGGYLIAMKRVGLASARFAVGFFLVSSLVFAAQDPNPPAKAPAQSTVDTARLTIEVTGGDNASPVDNASVYVKYVEEHAIKRDKKIELNVKTNREGLAHIPDAPFGRALVQIVADGWKTYGRWYDINDSKQVIKIRLEKPPKWY